MNQKNVDFSRKCRDRVNFFFQKLKITLKKIPIYQSTSLNWNRFEILERALQQIQILDGSKLKTNGSIHQEIQDFNRKDLNNKELCQLYRTRLNLGFEKLRNILEQKQELRQFRLFSRAGLLEAAVHYLERKNLETKNLETKLTCNGAALPKPNLKRERIEEDEEVISPSKIPKPYFTKQFPSIPNLNNSTGFESPDSASPVGLRLSTYSQQNHFYSLELARAQLIAYNRLIILNNATQMAQRESRCESAGVWRPW